MDKFIFCFKQPLIKVVRFAKLRMLILSDFDQLLVLFIETNKNKSRQSNLNCDTSNTSVWSMQFNRNAKNLLQRNKCKN